MGWDGMGWDGMTTGSRTERCHGIPPSGCIIARRKYEAEASTGLNIHEIYSAAGPDRQAGRE
jgi:hypothetical protein